MNDDIRFVKTMAFGNPDRIPLWECAFWTKTLERWAEEGMPGDLASGETEEGRQGKNTENHLAS